MGGRQGTHRKGGAPYLPPWGAAPYPAFATWQGLQPLRNCKPMPKRIQKPCLSRLKSEPQRGPLNSYERFKP